jgi:hypothetical protein
MAYEISRPTDAFFNAGARELSLGRICPYEFDDGHCRELPEKTLYKYFSGTKYEWLFMGTFWERLQTSVLWEGTKKWDPKGQDNNWVKALISIVHFTIELLSIQNLPVDICFSLHIYYDAHVPLMCAVEDASTESIRSAFHKYCPKTQNVLQEGNLPDIITLQLKCSFWNENKPKMEPIVHLMCKALPQRCQIRNLREIISNYCQTDDLVHEFMRSALLCSILGMYRHCKIRLDWKARKHILRRFVYMNPNRMQMQEWLFTIYQHLLFYIIKEFLTYSMGMIPALYEELCVTYKWNTFEKTVHTAMDNVRITIQKNVQNSSLIKEWFAHIESNLMQVNKQQLGNLFRPQRQTFTQTVVAICEKIDENNRQINPHVSFPREYRTIMREMIKRAKRGTVHVEWLQYFNVKQESIASLVNMYQHYHQNTYRTDLRKLLQGSSRHDFEAIRELFSIYHQTHHEIRVFYLPEHYYAKQCAALRRRYGLTADEPIENYVGEIYCCLSCNTFKGFTIKDDGKCNNLFANGHHKIIVDDETLKCYCGRRCEKTDTKKRKRIALESFLDGVELDEHRKRRDKKTWKTSRKAMQNDLCATTECLKFNMLGTILQFYGSLYLFCPSCGNPTSFKASQFDEHGFTCGQCLKEGTLYTSVNCYICSTFRGKDSWTSIRMTDEGEESSVAICNGCYRPWLRQYEQPIPKQVLVQQQQKLRKNKNPKCNK